MDFARTELTVEDITAGVGSKNPTGIVPTNTTLLVDNREVALSLEHPIIVETSHNAITTTTVTILIDKVTMHQVNKP